VAAFGKAVSCPLIKVVQYWFPPMLYTVTPSSEFPIITSFEAEDGIVQQFGHLLQAILLVKSPFSPCPTGISKEQFNRMGIV
jgi:hypothetical protein